MSILSCSLQSGSNGNCIYVETADARLIFDAGISGKTAFDRLAHHKIDMNKVDGLLLSHNHSDHVRAAGVFHRRCRFPVFATPGTWNAISGELGQVRDVRNFAPGATLRFKSTTVETIPTPHDGKEGVAFVVGYAGRRLGIFTDLGHRFAGLDACVSELDGLYLESNYDPEMLESGPYPPWLKKRISGAGGHLSNLEAAELVRDAGARLHFVVLSHLSEHNNTPQLAMKTAQEHIPSRIPIGLASRYGVSDCYSL